MSPKLLRPIGDDIILIPIEDPELTPGGLHIPFTAKQRVDQGIVVAKGPLVTDEIDIGDHVLFSGYTGDKVTLEDCGIRYVIPEPLIVAIIEDSENFIIDIETVKRVLVERKGELRMKYFDDIERSKLVTEIADGMIERLDTITATEGFEF